MPDQGRDRLRELLDAVLDDDHRTLGEMAEGAYCSPFHFSRRLAHGAGEPPVTMRRRGLLERAPWELGGGASVTEVAFAAGYESVEGFARAFARAFGHPPAPPPPGTAPATGCRRPTGSTSTRPPRRGSTAARRHRPGPRRPA